MNFYDYIFYRLVTFRNKKISTNNSVYSTILLLSIIATMYVMIMLVLASNFVEIDFDVFAPEASWGKKLAIPISVLLLNIYYFYGANRYKKKISYFGNNSKSLSSKSKDIFVAVYIFLPFAIALFFLSLGVMGYLD